MTAGTYKSYLKKCKKSQWFSVHFITEEETFYLTKTRQFGQHEKLVKTFRVFARQNMMVKSETSDFRW